jgi:hypothetical protein
MKIVDKNVKAGAVAPRAATLDVALPPIVLEPASE